jgi:hypothetical protein
MRSASFIIKIILPSSRAQPHNQMNQLLFFSKFSETELMQ